MLPREPNPSDFNHYGFHKREEVHELDMLISKNFKTGLNGNYLPLTEQINKRIINKAKRNSKI
ncbi:MAG: hypothetical protein HRT47_03325 [Candidatus Caenarcaniphilales bacterium]|nr:hypothetical protein [Candidatus Caenarcaniphilales bacterium]